MSKTYIPVATIKQVRDRAKNCCEYCLMPEIATFASHEVDYIIAKKHGGLTQAENLALSCTLCNKYKGSDLTSIDPETGEIVPLYHPRQDSWPEHFYLKDAKINPLTAKGRVKVRLLQLNRPEKVQERQLLIEAGILAPPSN
ncbi:MULTISPECIES: HNH endonuclease [Planktothricoides]|uniref:HNH endonuclease n=2 Tax=Planktothricoides raciborskii TaxID=132608 RepID=A0AAU8J9W7_9CYAN|nr:MULTISPECIES: HNH endonuclease [Planktothricoides]KOR36489.1 HNH endonuclease [Planktothricoides sp. SR001]MBD2543967.1 HNH endonuclease [Planktothricoides raciborskii FACHB-1370]MBD2582955.1 HNH endonuclease [Planktothricoides raciborskii FACHB-1261]